MRRRSFLEAAAAIIPASITLGIQKPTASEDGEPSATPSMVPIFWDAKDGRVTTNPNGNEKFGYVINPAD